MTAPKYLTVAELAELLNCSHDKIRDLAGDGEIPGFKIGEWRFPLDLIVEHFRGLALANLRKPEGEAGG